MGIWVKHFIDGTCEVGRDKDIAAGRASWSRGRLDLIEWVGIQESDWTGSIVGVGDYWQSDVYESVILSDKSTRIKRRISRQIRGSDRFYVVFTDERGYHNVIFNDLNLISSEIMRVLITPNMVGKWVVLEYDIRDNRTMCYLSERRV